jgi:PTS system nitrogen regulatory IIA component
MNAHTERVKTWLQPEQVHLDVPLQDTAQALQFIADAVGRVHGLDPAPIFRALSRREQAGSTGLGAGFAVPHARIPGIERPLTCLVRVRAPIEFKAPDHEPVSLMLAILVPEQGDRNDHLQLLGRVAELFSRPRFRARMDTDADIATIERSFEAGIAQLEA